MSFSCQACHAENHVRWHAFACSTLVATLATFLFLAVVGASLERPPAPIAAIMPIVLYGTFAVSLNLFLRMAKKPLRVGSRWAEEAIRRALSAGGRRKPRKRRNRTAR
jgi:hypothetical protein